MQRVWAELFSPLLLYASVIIGLFVFHSGWAAILGYHLAIVLVITAAGGWPLAKTLFKGWSPKGLGVILGGALSGIPVLLVWSWMHREGVTMDGLLTGLGLSGLSWLLFIPYYSLINPWLEELYWRAWYASKTSRPTTSDLLFSGYHLFVLILFVKPLWIVPCFFVLLMAAWTMRIFSRRVGGLLVPCLGHVAADLSIIIAAALLR